MRRMLSAYACSPVFLVSALLLLLSASAAWYVQQLYQDLAEVLESNVASVRAAEELEIGLREIRTRLNELIYRSVDLDISPLQETTDHWLAEAERHATTLHEQEIVRRLKEGYLHFFEELDVLLATPEGGAHQSTDIRDLIDSILTKEIIAPAHEYLDYNEGTMVAVARAHRTFSSRISFALLGIGICGSIGGFFGGVHASHRMRRSMVELNLPLSLTAGKLSEVVDPIRLSTSLDLGELKRVLDIIAIEVDRLVARFQKSQEEILRSEKLAAIGQLAAVAAHEIRNPLMSIKLLAQSALANPSQLPLREKDVQLIEQEASRLEKTVQSLLDFARPPAIARKEFPMRRLVEHCVALISGRATIQGVSIEQQSTSDDLVVEGDYQQLQQVLLNLLINSLDATLEGGQIRIIIEQRDGADVKVTVEDSGKGIPEPLIPMVFEPFTSTKETGTGLGLSISRTIVEAHTGRIFAANREAGGAVVGFTLPHRSNRADRGRASSHAAS